MHVRILLTKGTSYGTVLTHGAKNPTITVRTGALMTHSMSAQLRHLKEASLPNRKSFRAITSFVFSVSKSKSSMPFTQHTRNQKTKKKKYQFSLLTLPYRLPQHISILLLIQLHYNDPSLQLFKKNVNQSTSSNRI